MSPFEEIAGLYAEHPQAKSFAWYLNWYSMNGFVFATPEFFAMGGPCWKRDLESGMPGIEAAQRIAICSEPEGDCWYVHALAGNMRRAWSIMPYYLPWFAFERLRRNETEVTLDLSFYRTEALQRLIPPERHETLETVWH